MALRIRMTMEYDGTDYFGWQKQKRPDQPSIQGTLEECLSRVFQEPIRVIGSGRTDRGVHARKQVAHCDLPEKVQEMDLLHTFHQLLPPSLVVQSLEVAPAKFHAQIWAKRKSYSYRILNRRLPSSFWHRYSLHHPWPLELDYLNRCSAQLLGKHDFKSFQSSGTPIADTIREIFTAEWRRDSEDFLLFEISGSGFLKQMVRNIVGSILEMAKNGQDPGDLATVLAGRDRRLAGPVAPPQGLILEDVYYGPEVDNRCRKL